MLRLMPAKNLMDERRRRKKMNDRLYMLRSVVPKISKELMSFVRSYVVLEGFPDGVTASYVPYITWRALKHFFVGAMGDFTTQTLLSSIGISRNRASPGAVAINWILKITINSTHSLSLSLYDKEILPSLVIVNLYDRNCC